MDNKLDDIVSIINEFKTLNNEQNQKIENKIQILQDELINIRRLLIYDKICPELFDRLAPKIELPKNEKGETYEKYFRRENIYLRNWINEAYFKISDVFEHYCNQSFSLDEMIERAKFLQENDADFLAFFNIMNGLMLDDTKLEFAKKYFDNIIKSSNFDKFVGPYHWFRLIGFYLEQNYEAEALELLDRFQKKFDNNLIKNWLPAADLAYRNGNKSYSLQSTIYQEILSNNKKYSLEDLFANKKVALIGNGPQELGKKQGKYIDSFDMVIRMNTYNLTQEYSEDYGLKCDLRYRIANEMDQQKTYNYGNPKFSFLGCNPECFAYSDSLIKQYEKDIAQGQIFLSYTYPLCRWVRKITQNNSPSGGLSLISLINKVNKSFSSKDCFGFSFKENTTPTWNHCNGEVLQYPEHNLVYEKQIIKNIFAGENL